MNTFLNFVFNSENLRQYLREEWMQFYDDDYIDSKIIGAIEKNLPSVQQIMHGIERKATGKITSTLSQSSSMRGDEEQSNYGVGSAASHLNKSNTFQQDVDLPQK